MSYSSFRSFENSHQDLFGDNISEEDLLGLILPLRALMRRLGSTMNGEDSLLEHPEACRTAPSLISRSDAALFKVSYPRFALRAYFDPCEKKSFANLRRINRMWLSLSEKGRSVVAQDGNGNNTAQNWKILELIGDCFLSTPNRFRHSYRVIEANLAAAYGESDHVNEGSHGTPYVSYPEIAGSCGHAVAYIASALMNEAEKVYGLAEIAALLARDGSTFGVGLMSYNDLEYYFSKIGLIGNSQTIPQEVLFTQDVNDGTVRKIYLMALRAYINSGFPAIVMVDLQRLNGTANQYAPEAGDAIQDINKTGLTFEPAMHSEYKISPHFVVLVGCSNRATGEAFLMHDPASLPFLQIGIDKLLQSAPYLEQSTTIKTAPPSFLSVTPKDVNVPLLSSVGTDSSEKKGLIELASAAQIGSESEAIRELMDSKHIEPVQFPGDFSLIELDASQYSISNDFVIHAWLMIGANLQSKKSQALRRTLDCINDQKLTSRYVWVQLIDGELWIWKACGDKTSYQQPDRDTIVSYVLNVLVCDETKGEIKIVKPK